MVLGSSGVPYMQDTTMHTRQLATAVHRVASPRVEFYSKAAKAIQSSRSSNAYSRSRTVVRLESQDPLASVKDIRSGYRGTDVEARSGSSLSSFLVDENVCFATCLSWHVHHDFAAASLPQGKSLSTRAQKNRGARRTITPHV